jgi:hypothetical protein
MSEAASQEGISEARPVEPAEPTRNAEPSAAVVPIPGSLRTESPKKPFWRRISLRGTTGRSEGSLPSPTDDDRVLARLDAMTALLAASSQRIEQLDDKFTEVWEVEETLSRLMELHDRLTEMRERQGRIDGRVRGVERRLTFIAVLAGTAAVAAIAAAAASVAPAGRSARSADPAANGAEGCVS